MSMHAHKAGRPFPSEVFAPREADGCAVGALRTVQLLLIGP